MLRFYDGVQGTLKNDENIYCIGLCKFEYDVAQIIRNELDLIDKEVVAKNIVAGKYELGKKYFVNSSIELTNTI